MATKHIPRQSLGHWLPRNRQVIAKWVKQKVEEAKGSDDELLPSVRAFQQLVNCNDDYRRLANNMFTEASNRYPKDPTGACAIQSFDEFINVLNNVVQAGPEFYDTDDPPTAMGLIGFPINALLDWPMGTASGYGFFLLPEINTSLQSVLNDWGELLKNHTPQKCLEEWTSQDAQRLLAGSANIGNTCYTFDQIFLCPDVSKPFLGFTQWDEFFTRCFKDGIRPIEAPDNAPDLTYPDPTAVIVNACESAPLQFQTGVKLLDNFWIKEQPYSLVNMLNGNLMAQDFADGSVYQAFLSAKSYHRWHAPVSGKVVAIEKVPGTYYSENFFEGLAADPDSPDPAAPNYSQPYISAVATRGIIYIQATNPKIGLMAIVFIGMAEVSSVEFTVNKNDDIVKGDEIGMFHFGGSSHCMVFRPGVDIRLIHPPPYDIDTEKNLAVKSAWAVVA
ncbi:phosphatidylserine decarboxylase-domain-containing protein [Whalleya microplaca]|nr:phosphatidylserine decarboxylase-domain-containing protein [Whalleya microplaca]